MTDQSSTSGETGSERVQEYKVSVRVLVETLLRSGDINFRFSPRSSALEGLRGHQKVQRGRPDSYQSEVQVSGVYRVGHVSLLINGRIDGVFRGPTPVIEEIKTLRIDVSDLPPSQSLLHWAQARVYAWLYALEHDISLLKVQVSYFDVDTEQIHSEVEDWTLQALDDYCRDITSRYLRWMERQSAWRSVRDASIARLDFPHPVYRQGQRTLAVSSYRNMVAGGVRFAEAPTGIGKTMGTLFPAIKGLNEHVHERIFYLTAKTVGREVAEQSIRELAGTGLRLKSLTLTAKDKICFTPGAPCDAEYCSYAKGYYDKLETVLEEALASHDEFSRVRIEQIAREHHMCPFELSLDLAVWVDTLICDYNYVFDPVVYLRRFFEDASGDYCFLVDEAHNLVDRGRAMYSASLYKRSLMAVRRDLKGNKAHGALELGRKLDGVNRAYLKLRKDHEDELNATNHIRLAALPAGFLRKIRAFCDTAEPYLAEHREAAGNAELLQLYFDALRLLRTAEWFDDTYVALLVPGARNDLRFWLYCLDPSRMIATGLARGKSTMLFSATLEPLDYYSRLLGVQPANDHLKLPSPFPADHLGLVVLKDIATSFRRREGNYDRLVEVIESVCRARTGNYIIYFPSYKYMDDIYCLFLERNSKVSTLVQTSDMTEEDRGLFLMAFEHDPDKTLVAFAVMGGVFGEGIDLTGTRLIGVVVVGVGLPQLGLERDLIRDHFDQALVAQIETDEDNPNERPAKVGSGRTGFTYAYQYPGMVRVLQTAGRVIRSESDRGIVCLVDERFALREYRRLYPKHWRPTYVRCSELVQVLDRFWASAPERP